MFKHFKLIPFVIGLLIGIVGIYVIKPERTVVHKYPNPVDKNKTIYKDKNGICYTYSAKKIDCDKNESRIKPFPLSK
jgi:hypothetical protein